MNAKPVYHIGLGIRKNTLVIEARRCVDFLSCELYDYMGERIITKKELYINRYKILELAKHSRPDVYGKLHFAIVD